jgi:hypothetical protein
MDRVAPFEFDGDMRDLKQVPLSRAGLQRRPYRPLLRPPAQAKLASPVKETAFAEVSAPLAPMPPPSQNFPGLNFTDVCLGGQCGDGWPPDPNGDVGLNHYIQAVNTAYAIYDKTGALLASFTEDQLWSPSGANPCNGNSQGDPVVLYDQLADRWILTHFAFAFSGMNPVSPFYQCIAASKTNDPVSGGWWLYPVRMDPGGTGPPVGALNDYSKFGIWPDCLYMAANAFHEPGDHFIGTLFASFSRSDLYSGAPLTFFLGFINSSTGTMIPSNMRGVLPDQLPPPGTPNYFVSESQNGPAFEVRQFTAGPNCGAGGGMPDSPTIVGHASYSFPNGAIIPQPNTTNKLDSIDDRLMQKVQYRKVGTDESLWVVHNVGTSPVTLQWAEIDVTGGVVGSTPVQQQIYAPDATLYRWMGSLAVDNQGNMALGYSTSNDVAPNFPSIAYSGRLASDPLNTLPQSEVQLIAGAGSQTNNCGGSPCDRWGDYSAMSVDPADDCTFWYTNQYYGSQANGTSGNWQTGIGSFKFPSCTAPVFTPHALTVVSSNPDGGVSVTVSPDDNDGFGDGITQFTRTYDHNTAATLTAPSSAGGNDFSHWAGCNSAVGIVTCNLTMNADQTVTAVYAPPPLVIGALSLPDGEVGDPYDGDLQIGGGVAPYTVSIISGTLPLGLIPNSNGIGGTPTKASPKKLPSFTVRVTDSAGSPAVTKTFTIKIFPVLAISTKSLKKGTVGKNYSATLKATGGKLPYAWDLASGSLPTGLNLNPSTGAITGIPGGGTQGTYNITARVTDSIRSVTKPLSLTIQ